MINWRCKKTHTQKTLSKQYNTKLKVILRNNHNSLWLMSEWNEINFYPPKTILPASFESSLLYRHDLRINVSILRREYVTTQILSLKLLLLMPYGNPFLYCSNYLLWQIVIQWFKASSTGAFWSNNQTNVIFFLRSIWYIICFERFGGNITLWTPAVTITPDPFGHR